jgi:hypothetical protein
VMATTIARTEQTKQTQIRAVRDTSTIITGLNIITQLFPFSVGVHPRILRKSRAVLHIIGSTKVQMHVSLLGSAM